MVKKKLARRVYSSDEKACRVGKATKKPTWSGAGVLKRKWLFSGCTHLLTWWKRACPVQRSDKKSSSDPRRTETMKKVIRWVFSNTEKIPPVDVPNNRNKHTEKTMPSGCSQILKNNRNKHTEKNYAQWVFSNPKKQQKKAYWKNFAQWVFSNPKKLIPVDVPNNVPNNEIKHTEKTIPGRGTKQ